MPHTPPAHRPPQATLPPTQTLRPKTPTRSKGVEPRGCPRGAPGVRQPSAACGRGTVLARNNAAGWRLLPVAALPLGACRSNTAAAAPRVPASLRSGLKFCCSRGAGGESSSALQLHSAGGCAVGHSAAGDTPQHPGHSHSEDRRVLHQGAPMQRNRVTDTVGDRGSHRLVCPLPAPCHCHLATLPVPCAICRAPLGSLFKTRLRGAAMC